MYFKYKGFGIDHCEDEDTLYCVDNSESDYCVFLPSLVECKAYIDMVSSEAEAKVDTPLTGLSNRTMYALSRNWNGRKLGEPIDTIEKLCECSEARLSAVRGIGRKAFIEIRGLLSKHGRHLLGDEE